MKSINALYFMAIMFLENLFESSFDIDQMVALSVHLMDEYDHTIWQGKENQSTKDSYTTFAKDLIKVFHPEEEKFTYITSHQKDELVDDDTIWYNGTQWQGVLYVDHIHCGNSNS